MRKARVVGAVVVVAALAFAVGGGEYGTFDWLKLRSEEKRERKTIAELKVEVDSLKRYAKQVETDKRLLERLARENFGMIRKGEFLYRLGRDSLDGE
ncbi:MAG TPA: septum formation initiator family protein [Gemmatimonadales bacterium]|nr:septum formation initiator family protein [Gemmatimonadales bacterium]